MPTIDNAEEKLTATSKAVRHVLARINFDAKTSFVMGLGTESYELLCAAVAALDGVTVEAVRDAWPPAIQPGQPARVSGSLSVLQAQVCEVLNVAPFIAAMIIRHGNRRGEPLLPCQPHASAEDRFAFEADAHRSYLAFFDRRCPARLQAA